MKSLKQILVLAAASALIAAPATYNVKKADGWTPVINGSISEWPSANLVDTIRGDNNVFARTSVSPWTPAEMQMAVYAAYDDQKVYFAVRVLSDNSIVTGSRLNGDNIKVNPGGQAMGFYVSTDGSTTLNPSCPFTLNSTLFTGMNMLRDSSGLTRLSYEFSIKRSVIDPFAMGQFQLSVGSEDRDADSSLCYLAAGVEYTGDKQAWGSNPWDNPMYYPVYKLAPVVVDTPHVIDSSVVISSGIVTGTIAQHTGAMSDGFMIGSGLDDVQGRCSFVWSKNLDAMGGHVVSAKIRGEYRDGWSGNAYCNAGPIAVRCGVADFRGNVETFGGVDNVPCNATWQDFLNPIGSNMGYDYRSARLQAEEIINITAPAGRPAADAPSVLDGQIFEMDVTEQVNWILANPGNHAIVFLVAPGVGSTGKINLYADECGTGLTTGSDNPVTQNGNSIELVLGMGGNNTQIVHSDSTTGTQVNVTVTEPVVNPGIVILPDSTPVEQPDLVNLISVNIEVSPELRTAMTSAELTISYDGMDLTGLDEGKLVICYLNGDSWDSVGGTVNADNKTITVTVTHFSTYGLFAPAMTSSAEVKSANVSFMGLNAMPNPVTSSTVVSYNVEKNSRVSLHVYNISGKLVRELVSGNQAAGAHAIAWNGMDNSGKVLPSGLYMVKLSAGNKSLTKAVTLMK